MILLQDFFDLDETSLIKHWLTELNKWYVLLICLGGGVFFIVFLGIGLCNYDPSDINKTPGNKAKSHTSEALITGSKRMYLKGDLFGCTNCEWTGDSLNCDIVCKSCGSHNCYHLIGTGLSVCKDCGSLDTKNVCPKCGHDLKTNTL